MQSKTPKRFPDTISLMNKLIYPVLALSLLTASAVKAESKSRIATIDAAKIMGNYSEAKKTLEEIQKADASLKEKIAAKRKLIDEARAAKKTETELQMMAEQFQLEIEPEAKKLEADSKAKSLKIQESVEAAVKAVAAEQKFESVLVQEAVIYGGTDISDAVIKKLGGATTKK